MLNPGPNSQVGSGKGEAQKTLTDEVENYVQSLLKQYDALQEIRELKVVHDPILGSNVFKPYEVALIDLPLCQRLRKISQTDVASMVYPSANHNRLEHSLGVATIAGRIIESLRRRESTRQISLVTPQAEMEVRIAAILHDIGHGSFSHLSEEIFKDFPEIELYRLQHPGMFDPGKPHEMLSHLIIKSSTFQDYFKEQIVKKYRLPSLDPKRIAEFIIPAGGKDEFYGWQAEIINGPFDADKFDYLQRDAYFSGLKIGIDLDRFLHLVWLESRPNEPRRLKIMTSGAITLEQILFGKLLLYNSVYHHQKIRAAECAIRGIFEILEDHPKSPEYGINGRKMNRAIDFLYVTEEDILSPYNKPEELRVYIQRFLNRELFKRALVISADTVIDPKSSTGYEEFKSLAESPHELKTLRRELVEALNRKYPIYQIWIDLPQTLTFHEASRAIIQDEDGEEARHLRDIFRVDEWLTAYWSNKWKGYVFYPPGKEAREEVGRKAAELLRDKYHFSLDIDKALGQAKIR